MLKGILKAVRFVASATVGLPLALAASAVVLTGALTLRAMDKCWSEFYKKAFSTDEVPNAFLKGAADASFAAFATIWTGFGFYAFRETAVAINNGMGRVASSLGFENHDQFYASSWKDHLDSDGVEKAALKEAKKTEDAITQREEKTIKKSAIAEEPNKNLRVSSAVVTTGNGYKVQFPQGSNLAKNNSERQLF